MKQCIMKKKLLGKNSFFMTTRHYVIIFFMNKGKLNMFIVNSLYYLTHTGMFKNFLYEFIMNFYAYILLFIFLECKRNCDVNII